MKFRFVIHKHNARNAGHHFDFRFENPDNTEELHSFMYMKNVDIENDKRVVMVKTRMHPKHWLDYSSYRAEIFDRGEIEFEKNTDIEFIFKIKGTKINGRFILQKLPSKRRDYWQMIRFIS